MMLLMLLLLLLLLPLLKLASRAPCPFQDIVVLTVGVRPSLVQQGLERQCAKLGGGRHGGQRGGGGVSHAEGTDGGSFLRAGPCSVRIVRRSVTRAWL